MANAISFSFTRQKYFIAKALKSIESLISSSQVKTVTISDQELIERYLNDRDQACFTVLYRRYAGKVFAKCCTMLGEENTARDAVQDIFIKVSLNLSKFNDKSSFSTWLYSVTYNFCIDMIRKKKKLKIIFDEDIANYPIADDVELPDSVLLDLKYQELETILGSMPPGDKAILLMKYQDGMQIKEIADHFGKTESAIKMQILRAKMRASSFKSNEN
jgi:RNA polymerase sigma factor (sigma-70 family)